MLTTMARYACELKDTLKLRTEDVTRLTNENGTFRTSRATLENELVKANLVIESLKQQLVAAEQRAVKAAQPKAAAEASNTWIDTRRVKCVDWADVSNLDLDVLPKPMQRAFLMTPLPLGLGAVPQSHNYSRWHKFMLELIKIDGPEVVLQDLFSVLRQYTPLLTTAPTIEAIQQGAEYTDRDIADREGLPKPTVVPEDMAEGNDELAIHSALCNMAYAGMPGFLRLTHDGPWIATLIEEASRVGWSQILVNVVQMLKYNYGDPGRDLGYYQREEMPPHAHYVRPPLEQPLKEMRPHERFRPKPRKGMQLGPVAEEKTIIEVQEARRDIANLVDGAFKANQQDKQAAALNRNGTGVCPTIVAAYKK